MAVFSSDLGRAKITAEGICRAQIAPPGESPLVPMSTRNLREKNYGSMEGKFWRASPPWPLPPGWVAPESKISMRRRVKTFFDEHLLPLLMRDPHGEQNVAVVAHGIILQQLWSYLIEIFNPADVDLAILSRRPVWSNTGYMTISITPKQPEMTPLPVFMQGFALVVLGIDGKEHLISLHRTRGGVASAAHDVKQKKIDQFFR